MWLKTFHNDHKSECKNNRFKKEKKKILLHFFSVSKCEDIHSSSFPNVVIRVFVFMSKKSFQLYFYIGWHGIVLLIKNDSEFSRRKCPIKIHLSATCSAQHECNVLKASKLRENCTWTFEAFSAREKERKTARKRLKMHNHRTTLLFLCDLLHKVSLNINKRSRYQYSRAKIICSIGTLCRCLAHCTKF